MSLPSLYTLTQQYQQLLNLDADEFDPQTLVDTLDGLQGDIQVKAQNIAATVLNVEALAEAASAASKRLADRAKRIQGRGNALRDYLKTSMESAGLTKIEGPEVTLAIQKNPPSVEVVDEDAIPDRYWIKDPPPPPSLDKKQILFSLKEGATIDGVRLNQRTRLEIKV